MTCHNATGIHVSRDPSPCPNISKALFISSNDAATTCVKTSSRKRSNRPSLEDDLQREAEKENIAMGQRRKSSKRSTKEGDLDQERQRPRGLSNRNCNNAAEIFQYPSPSRGGVSKTKFSRPSVIHQVPSIHVDDDEVFDASSVMMTIPPASSKLCLTPSTSQTPLLRYSSNFSSLIPSPNIDRGLCCSTPNRMRLETEGLDSTEKMILGRGAYGTVVLGKWRGRKVAIKVMEKEDGGKSVRRRKSLESELQAKDLEHKNVVKVFDVFAKDNKYAIIIMEYVGSRNLHRLLVESRDKVLGCSWLLHAAHQVSSALQHCHSRGIVHLDVKPANILVSSQGLCKLGDFGCSVSLSNPTLELDHSLVGTPGYQAPEFLRGHSPSPACDVYSLAILLWQLDSRDTPFQGLHPQTVMYQVVAAGVRPAVPEPAKACVNMASFTKLYQECWQSSPSSRPSINDIVETLSMLIRNRETRASSRVHSSVVSNKTLRL